MKERKLPVGALAAYLEYRLYMYIVHARFLATMAGTWHNHSENICHSICCKNVVNKNLITVKNPEHSFHGIGVPTLNK